MTTIGRSALIIGIALAVLISFRAGLYNIGGEGQLVVGGIVAALVGIYMPGPGPLVLVAGILAGMTGGALWAMLSGVLQVYLGVPLLIGSLLLNYPARYITSYLVGHPFRDRAARAAADPHGADGGLAAELPQHPARHGDIADRARGGAHRGSMPTRRCPAIALA